MSLKQFLKGNEPFASVARSPAISSVTSIVSISTCSQLRILIFLSLSLSAHPFLRRLTMHNFLNFFFKSNFWVYFYFRRRRSRPVYQRHHSRLSSDLRRIAEPCNEFREFPDLFSSQNHLSKKFLKKSKFDASFTKIYVNKIRNYPLFPRPPPRPLLLRPPNPKSLPPPNPPGGGPPYPPPYPPLGAPYPPNP